MPRKLSLKDVNISPSKSIQQSHATKLEFSIFQDSPKRPIEKCTQQYGLPPCFSSSSSSSSSSLPLAPLLSKSKRLFADIDDTFQADENVEFDDKENDVSKENLEPCSSADILNNDNLLNNSIIKSQMEDCEAPQTEDTNVCKKRKPLASKSIILYPGFLEIYDQPQEPSQLPTNRIVNKNTQKEEMKHRILHLPRKSSPLKPSSLMDFENMTTPLRSDYHKESSRSPMSSSLRDSARRKSPSIFSSPLNSPLKSKLTNKLLSLAAISSDEDSRGGKNNHSNSSLESVNSKSSNGINRSKLSNKSDSILSIPNLSSFSSDSLQRQKIFKDPIHFSPKKKSRISGASVSRRSSPVSVYSEYSESALNSPSGSSNNYVHNGEDFRKIRRLNTLWKTNESLNYDTQLSQESKKAVNGLLDEKLPAYFTPPRSVNKATLKSIVQNNHISQQRPQPRISKSKSLNDFDTITKNKETLSDLSNALSKPPQQSVNTNPDDINFGRGINDGYDENQQNKVKIDKDRLKFTIFSD
ncbi:hypothetical protein DASC09_035730 [Saccharomycopsis crataegensis]|uniref:Uncharacterized protein n=1 Tax=Saccharomycopsis crataegensis TaxID=43959 RepID=A0AAV5QN89_9ASCO|nr:hypothetical protein DASC09_035730 [Saccharomycopsis crataegensis]